MPFLGHGDFLFSAFFHFEINHLTQTYPTDTPVYFELVKIVPTTCWCPHLPAPIPLPFRISAYSQGQPRAQNSLAITLSSLFTILSNAFVVISQLCGSRNESCRIRRLCFKPLIAVFPAFVFPYPGQRSRILPLKLL